MHELPQCLVGVCAALTQFQLNGRGRHFYLKGALNFLVRLTQDGFIRRVAIDNTPLPAFDENTVTKEAAVPSRMKPDLTWATPEEQARGYLHANCTATGLAGAAGKSYSNWIPPNL